MGDLERKVSQLEADIHEIYNLLGDLRDDLRRLGANGQRQSTRLDHIETGLNDLKTGQQALVAAHTDHSSKLDQLIGLLTPRDQSE